MNTLRYYPHLNTLTGGINGTLLMLQIEYWFERTEGKSFFKFLEPCEDVHYKVGDSWSEELGFTKAEFRSAFAKIGKVYKSKKAFLESEDKFEGKYYLSYYDRIKRLTYYLRNDERVDSSLGETLSVEMSNAVEGPSRSLEHELPLSVDYITSPQSLLEKSLDSTDESLDEVPCENIVDLYHETCVSLEPVKQISPSIRSKLNLLWQSIEGKMETLRAFFRQVEASDFLSGRLPHKAFRASFEWLIKGNKYIEVLQGKYRNRFSKQAFSVSEPSGKFHKMASHNWDFSQLEALEQAYIEKKIKSIEMHSSPLLSKLLEGK